MWAGMLNLKQLDVSGNSLTGVRVMRLGKSTVPAPQDHGTPGLR